MELFQAPTASVFDTENKEDIDSRSAELDYGLKPASLAFLALHPEIWLKIYMAQRKDTGCFAPLAPRERAWQ